MVLGKIRQWGVFLRSTTMTITTSCRMCNDIYVIKGPKDLGICLTCESIVRLLALEEIKDFTLQRHSLKES